MSTQSAQFYLMDRYAALQPVASTCRGEGNVGGSSADLGKIDAIDTIDPIDTIRHHAVPYQHIAQRRRRQRGGQSGRHNRHFRHRVGTAAGTTNAAKTDKKSDNDTVPEACISSWSSASSECASAKFFAFAVSGWRCFSGVDGVDCVDGPIRSMPIWSAHSHLAYYAVMPYATSMQSGDGSSREWSGRPTQSTRRMPPPILPTLLKPTKCSTAIR